MTNITVEEIHDRLASGENLILVDVREPYENAEFAIGGILLPLGQIQMMQIDDIEQFKNEEVICYCRSGQRSMMAAMMLETFGFTDVKNLSGGILKWKERYGG